MHHILTEALRLLQTTLSSEKDVIDWGTPVLAFGNILNADIATVGINPSNREFVDEDGHELTGRQRRFHTTSSLGLNSWSNVSKNHIDQIINTFEMYFYTNPYDIWFKKLDFIMSGFDSSYYFPVSNACHLDLVPFATKTKWGELKPNQQLFLLDTSAALFGFLLQQSPVNILILNGKTVVSYFERVAGVSLVREIVPGWELPRSNGRNVKGVAFTGLISRIGPIPLGRQVLVLGFNHNLQSSFGVTKEVQCNIKNWMSNSVRNFKSWQHHSSSPVPAR